MKRRIVIPTDLPGGLEAVRSSSFQHCSCFTVVDVDRSGQRVVGILPNAPPEEGDELSRVNALINEGAEVVIVEEIERLPLAGLQFANIEVFRGFGRKASTALHDYRNGILQPLYYGSSPFCLSGPAAMHP